MRLLVALPRFPWPLEKGDKLRAWYQLKGLAQNHEIHLVCLSEDSVSENDLAQVGFCKSVQVVQLPKSRIILNLFGALFNSLPFQVNYYKSSRMRQIIAETIQKEKIEASFVQLIRLGENLPFEAGSFWVLDYMDTFSIGMKQRISESKFWLRPLVKSEARRLTAYETAIAAKFDEMTIISERDAEGLPNLIRPHLHIIPNGVSDTFFEQLPIPKEKDFDLIFFGNMGYHPNVQAARWLMEEVMPILHQKGRFPKICIAGARPAAVIKAFEGPNVTVTGFVDDIRKYVLRSKISVAPLVGGQGLQNKLIEAMALGIPVVTTPLSNSALGATPNKQLLVAESPEAFAHAIIELLDNPTKCEKLVLEGRNFVEENFRWQAMNAKLERVLALGL